MGIRQVPRAARLLSPFLPLLLTLCFATPNLRGQAAVCGPAPAVKLALDSLPEQTPQQTDWQFHEQHLAALRALLSQYPGDLFVEGAYIGSSYSGSEKARAAAEFKARHDQDPDSAPLAYLYGMTLLGRQSAEAIKLFNAALEKDPNFARAHLQLTSIYGSPVFLDKEQQVAHLKAFLEACPSSVEGYRWLARMEEKDLARSYAAPLRALLEKRSDPDAVGAYSTLWALEFNIHPSSEYAALRQQVEQDLQRLRQLKLENVRPWYEALAGGYRLVHDQKQADWAEEQERIRLPQPWSSPAMEKWQKDHHYPAGDASPEKKQAYYRDLLQQSAQWVKERPNVVYIWTERLAAMEHLDDVPASDVRKAVDQTLDAVARTSGPEEHGYVASFNAARLLAKKHLDPQRVVQLAEKGLANWEIDSRIPPYDLYATPEFRERSKFSGEHWRLEGMRLETEGYLQLKQPDKAQFVLEQMDERLQDLNSLAGDKPERRKSYSGELSSYWGLMAREAELRGRKLDAMAFYENALLARLEAGQKPEAGTKDELAENARQMWTGLGGTDEGWKLWYGRRADALTNQVQLTWEE
jgi:hypothetical protein